MADVVVNELPFDGFGSESGAVLLELRILKKCTCKLPLSMGHEPDPSPRTALDPVLHACRHGFSFLMHLSSRQGPRTAQRMGTACLQVHSPGFEARAGIRPWRALRHLPAQAESEQHVTYAGQRTLEKPSLHGQPILCLLIPVRHGPTSADDHAGCKHRLTCCVRSRARLRPL